MRTNPRLFVPFFHVPLSLDASLNPHSERYFPRVLLKIEREAPERPRRPQKTNHFCLGYRGMRREVHEHLPRTGIGQGIRPAEFPLLGFGIVFWLLREASAPVHLEPFLELLGIDAL